ncbi:hypothetical protein MPH_02469 [Macrophomina phaseolina MS6]|uniref:Uncharacterized protein n=1 Tax=Macrophomina phaseolina (strain MS6) TaxID=1126212 RepID=K2RCG4_MACPH|nr:hypothetical protein MPH_02469 [Macrophomina phaseolina MS6]
MTIRVEMGKFEMLRAKWEAQQQQQTSRPNSNALAPSTPARTPAHLRRFYTSSNESRESKVRRFSSIAAFTSPINPFSHRDRSGMPFLNPPSTNALVEPKDRQDPPPPLKRGPASRLPSFKSVPNNMSPPPLPPHKHIRQPTQLRPPPGLPRSHTMSHIPLPASTASGSSRASPTKHPPSRVLSRRTAVLGQPSQSTSSVIRSRPPTPHRSSDAPLPVDAPSSSNMAPLPLSSSSSNLHSKLPVLAVAKEQTQAGIAAKMFAGMTRKPRAAKQRSYTQPNLPSTVSASDQLGAPRETVFREELYTRTPRYMAAENVRPAFLNSSKTPPTIDDLFAPDDSSDLSGKPEDDLHRWGVVGEEAWGSPRVVKTPSTIKPRRNSGVRQSSIPRFPSMGSTSTNDLLASLSLSLPPRTPRHSTAHSQSLPPPGSGVSRPNILRDSQLSPCPEDSCHYTSSNHYLPPKTAISTLDRPFPHSWSPPPSPTTTPSNISNRSSSSSSSSPSLSLSLSPSPLSLFNPHTVTTAEPAAYWAGRFSALFDRFRLSAFQAEGAAFRDSCCISDTFGAFIEDGENQRARRVFAELASCCLTEDAARSLKEFQRGWAERNGCVVCMPPAAAIVLGNSGGGGGENGGCDEVLKSGDGKGRRTGIGFMERLKVIAREAKKTSS